MTHAWKISSIALVLVAAGHFFAVWQGLYAKTFWFDSILHFLSGIMFASIILIGIKSQRELETWLAFFAIIGFAVLGSFIWELWEYGAWKLVPDVMEYSASLPDTLSDMSFGLLGGIILAVINFAVLRLVATR